MCSFTLASIIRTDVWVVKGARWDPEWGWEEENGMPSGVFRERFFPSSFLPRLLFGCNSAFTFRSISCELFHESKLMV